MKNKFIKSTIILIIGGFITKLLSMVIRIALTRAVSTEGIGLYMLVLPTFNLFITLSTLGLPSAISKLVSERKRSNKRLILSIFPLIMIFNIILMFIVMILSPIISKYFLKNINTMYPIMAIGLTLPFICLSNILKGYFFGNQKMFPHVLSVVIEQLTRLFLTIYFIPKLLVYNLTIAITGVVLINIISEFFSFLTLMLFLPKKIKISKEDFKIDKNNIRDTLSISIPTTGSRLIGSICYFIEPIILTYTLLKTGYTNDYIVHEYGIITGYVLPLLTLPSFFSVSISNALLPIVSNSYSNKKIDYTRKKIKQGILYSLAIGIPITIIIFLFPDKLLNLIYHTTKGVKYIKVTSIIFISFYIQGPLTISLQAMNKAKVAMKGTLYGSLIKIATLLFFNLFHIGMWGLIISTCSNVIFVTIHHLYYVNKYLQKQ